VDQAGSDDSDRIEARLQRKPGGAIVAKKTAQAGTVVAVVPPQQGQTKRSMYLCSSARSTKTHQRRTRDEAATCFGYATTDLGDSTDLLTLR
jgi:hypothetical protein